MLTEAQNIAIENVSNYALGMKSKYQEQIDMILYQSNIDNKVYSTFCSIIQKHSCISIHFHPDRLTTDGLTVVKSLNQSGYYKNQFETNISSGSVTTFKGGFRDEWEKIIFGGAYENSLPSERPKYGTLNLTLTEDGASPRFGSCYFVLKPKIKNRATFSYGDTHLSPREIGTAKNFELITAALFNDLFTRGTVLGENNTSVLEFMKLVNDLIPHSPNFGKYRKSSRNLDFYIESQVHGNISISKDIIGLVADYSFYGTDVGLELEDLCKRYSINLNWNSGLELKANDFPTNFRGEKVLEFARKYSKGGLLNAFLIGEASKEIDNNYDNLQMLKYLWHCIVKFGKNINKASRQQGNRV